MGHSSISGQIPGSSTNSSGTPQPPAPILGTGIDNPSPYAPDFPDDGAQSYSADQAAGFAGDPLAYAKQVAQNNHGYSLSGQGGALPTGGLPAANFATGGLLSGIGLPRAGSLAPQASFSQNSVVSGSPNAFLGNGWDGQNFQFNDNPGSNCSRMIDCTGYGSHYEQDVSDPTKWHPDSPGYFSTFQGGSFVGTQINGFQLIYSDLTDSPPQQLLRMQSRTRAGSQLRWTLTRDGSQAPKAVIDPVNRRLTYSYDGNHFLKRVQDVAGRITTFVTAATPDTSSYNITGVILPNRNRMTMTYASTVSNLYDLTSLTTPDGQTWTYRYGDIFPSGHKFRAIISPLGYRTSFLYVDHTHPTPSGTRVLDPRGYSTSFVLDLVNSSSVSSVVNPLLQRTTYTWLDVSGTAALRLASAADANGRTSFTWHPNSYDGGTLEIASVRKQASGIFTYVYDTNDRIVGLINQKSDRTTLVWDADGFRTAVINAKNLRTSYSYNSSGQITAVIDPLLRRTSYVYDALGERSAIINPAGERTSYVYNAYGQVIATINPLGNRTTQVRDNMNRVVGSINANGFRTTYLYDVMDRLVATVNPLLNRFTQVYDIEGRLIGLVDQTGSRTSFTYDGNRNRTSVLDPLLNRTTYIYNAANQLVGQINPLLQRTSFVYDAAGNQVALIDPLLARATTVYDADRRVIGTIDALNQRSTVVYDGLGNTIATIDALGRRFTSVYDSLARRVATIDPALGRVTYSYDNANRLTFEQNSAGRTSYVYDLAGRSKATINALGNRFTSVYDAAGQLIASINPLLERNSFVYDKAGQQVAAIDGLGKRVTSIYDAASQRIATIDPLLNRTTYIYDKAGRQVATLDAEFNRTTSVFDAAGRVAAQIDGNSHRTSFAYDAASRQSALIDANLNRTTFGYDANGQVVSQKDPLSRLTTIGYDAIGRLSNRLDARGVRATYTYNAVGWGTGRKYSDGTRVTFTYDTLGNRTLMRDSSGRYTYSYDGLSRLKFFHYRSGNRLSYTYDALGQRRSLQSLAGRFTYTFDAAGRSVGLQDPRTTWTYDAAGRTLLKYNGNGTRVSYSYDDADRVTQMTNFSTVSYYDSYANTYDKVGNRTRTIDAAGRRFTYLYDRAYQLLHDATSTTSYTYTYDAVGNRLQFLRSATDRVTYSYDAANQITKFLDGAGRYTFTYDAAGNPTKQRNTSQPFNITLTWDAESRLRTYFQAGTASGNNFSQRLTHTYNGDGLRVQRLGGPASNAYVWDGENVHLKLTLPTFALGDSFIYEPHPYGMLVATKSASATLLYPIYDNLGSTFGLTTQDPQFLDAWNYSAWGEMKVAGKLNTHVFPFLYVGRTGYFTDDEGRNSSATSPLLPEYVRARFYHPVWGRWLNLDPLQFNSSDFNLYRYVVNNPVNVTDPSGAFACPAGTIPSQNPLYNNKPNGCTAPLIGDSPPGSGTNFKPCCDAHDICYGTCGSNKAACDTVFAACLQRLCRTAPPSRRWRCNYWAMIYSQNVRNLGGLFFPFDSTKCICIFLPPRCPPGQVIV